MRGGNRWSGRVDDAVRDGFYEHVCLKALSMNCLGSYPDIKHNAGPDLGDVLIFRCSRLLVSLSSVRSVMVLFNSYYFETVKTQAPHPDTMNLR